MPLVVSETAVVAKDDLIPVLNNYIATKISSKTEAAPAYPELAKALGAFKPSDENAAKNMQKKVVARLALFGHVPSAMIQQLQYLQKLPTDGKKVTKKLVRLVNYLLQLAVGEGTAGTPVANTTTTEVTVLASAVEVLDFQDLEPVWVDASSEKVPHTAKTSSLRILAAAAKAYLAIRQDPGPLAATLLDVINAAILKGEEARGKRERKGFLMKTKGPQEMLTLQRMAYSAARIGLDTASISHVAPQSFTGITSSDAVGARHAMSIAALVARYQPQAFLDAVTNSLQTNLKLYKMSGSLVVDPTAHGDALNLRDPWCRVYLARACGLVVHSNVVAGDIGGPGAPFWTALTIMATSDPSDFVALEAIRAVSGGLVPKAASLRAPPSAQQQLDPRYTVDADLEQERQSYYVAAWKLLMLHAEDPVPAPGAGAGGAPFLQSAGLDKSRSMSLKRDAAADAAAASLTGLPAVSAIQNTIIGRMLTRVANAMLRPHAEVCAACRTVACFAEARSHAWSTFRSDEVLGPPALRTFMDFMQDKMVAIAKNDLGLGAHSRSLALQSLLWMQLPGRPIVVSPGGLMGLASRGGQVLVANSPMLAPWPRDVFAGFLYQLLRKLNTMPMLADYLMQCAAALAAACPSRVSQEQLTVLWETTMNLGYPDARIAAVKAALEIAGAPPPAVAQPPALAPVEVKAAAVAEEQAAAALSRLAVFWLGENANFATEEYAWRPRPSVPPPAPGADVTAQEQLAAVAVAGNPVLSLIISNLHRAMFSASWDVRVVAAQSIAKVAVRSGEPFRIQCYSALASVCNPADPLGLVAAAGQSVELLDAMYAGEKVVESMFQQHGAKMAEWPEEMKEGLVTRHDWLYRSICERICFMPKELFFPLGPASKSLLQRGEVEEAMYLAAMAALRKEPAEPPESPGSAPSAEYRETEYRPTSPKPDAAAAMLLDAFTYGAPANDDSSDDGVVEPRPDYYGEQYASGYEDDVAGSRGIVLYDFDADGEEEVSVSAGEKVDIEYEMGGWLQVVTARGTKGLVPSSYVQITAPGSIPSMEASASYREPVSRLQTLSQQSSMGRPPPDWTGNAPPGYDPDMGYTQFAFIDPYKGALDDGSLPLPGTGYDMYEYGRQQSIDSSDDDSTYGGQPWGGAQRSSNSFVGQAERTASTSSSVTYTSSAGNSASRTDSTRYPQPPAAAAPAIAASAAATAAAAVVPPQYDNPFAVGPSTTAAPTKGSTVAPAAAAAAPPQQQPDNPFAVSRPVQRAAATAPSPAPSVPAPAEESPAATSAVAPQPQSAPPQPQEPAPRDVTAQPPASDDNPFGDAAFPDDNPFGAPSTAGPATSNGGIAPAAAATAAPAVDSPFRAASGAAAVEDDNPFGPAPGTLPPLQIDKPGDSAESNPFGEPAAFDQAAPGASDDATPPARRSFQQSPSFNSRPSLRQRERLASLSSPTGSITSQSSVQPPRPFPRDTAVLFEFVAEGEGELTVAPGDRVEVLGELDGWLQVVRLSDGQSGLVPASYVDST